MAANLFRYPENGSTGGSAQLPVHVEEEIKYCLDLAQCDALIFGPEFTERGNGHSRPNSECVDGETFVGVSRPAFAENYYALTACYSAVAPEIKLSDDDDAAIYFSSGTTGFPKAILHGHHALMFSCEVEMNHHKQTRQDNFLCIPPLYHTGAKMHWFEVFGRQ